MKRRGNGLRIAREVWSAHFGRNEVAGVDPGPIVSRDGHRRITPLPCGKDWCCEFKDNVILHPRVIFFSDLDFSASYTGALHFLAGRYARIRTAGFYDMFATECEAKEAVRRAQDAGFRDLEIANTRSSTKYILGIRADELQPLMKDFRR